MHLPFFYKIIEKIKDKYNKYKSEYTCYLIKETKTIFHQNYTNTFTLTPQKRSS